jgi:hypothetical protein
VNVWRIFLFLSFFVSISANLLAAEPSNRLGEGDNPAITYPQDGYAEPIDELDETGFDDDDTPAINFVIDEAPSKYSIDGNTGFLVAYNYAQAQQSQVAPTDRPMDFSGLSRALVNATIAVEMKHGDNWRSKIEISGWHDASWAFNGRDNFTQGVLDSNESFLDIKDFYIQGSLNDNLDLKFGRQIVIWGKSDSIRITDVINPLDNRQPGMVDIEDLRLSEVMTRLDYYFGEWGLSTIIIHEPRLEIEAAFGSDYRPADVFGTPIPSASFPARDKPDWSISNSQFAMSLDGRFNGWDIALYAARVYDNRFDIKLQNDQLVRTVELINMLGAAANVVSGSWLFKAEAAFINDVSYRSTEPKNRLDVLVGFDYMGIKNTVLSLELADRHIFNYEEEMLTMTLQQAAAVNTFADFVREDSLQIALRGSYSFDHDNAKVNYLLSLFGGNGEGDDFDGGFQRLWLDYKVNDAVSLNAGIVDYIGGQSLIPFFSSIADNDRVFVEIQYSF